MGNIIANYKKKKQEKKNSEKSHFDNKEQELNYYKNELNKQTDRVKKLEDMMIKFTKYHSEYDNELKREKDKIEKKVLKEISRQKISDFVNVLLNDENINIQYLPDIVERQIYTNVLMIIFSLLNHSLDNFDINFLDHKLKCSFNPTIPDSEIDETKIIINKTKKIKPKQNILDIDE